MILWIIIGILWTIVVLAAGYSGGVQQEKTKLEENPGPVTYSVANPEVTEEMREQLWTLWTAYNDGKFKSTFDTLSAKRLNILWVEHENSKNDPDGGDLLERVKSLEDRDGEYRTRFTRVEKKAGLSV